jgi:hypothetical protein
MSDNIRKQTVLPAHLDYERLVEIFTRLEAQSEKEQSQRVEKILDLLSRLGDDLVGSEKVRVITSLRNALHRYHWMSQVSPTLQGYRVITFFTRKELLSKDDVWEYEAVRVLLEIVPYLGRRPRIRRCADAQCRKWFFAAKRDDQKFCGGNCKQHNYENAPEKRAKKRDSMRALYAAEKARARNPKSGVGLLRPAQRGAKRSKTAVG